MAADEDSAIILDYPVQLGIAYLFLAGYLMRTLFVSLQLPASVGVIIIGFAFSYFFQADVFSARDVLQELAFFLVLLTAGLEIRLQDLRLYIFVMAWLPATFELLAVAGYGVLVLRFTLPESLVLGTVLVAIGDGLVIPKMKEFGARFPGHPLPRLVFTWAPLEASFALTLFGMLVGLAAPANEPHINLGVLFLANVLRICATIFVGALLGSFAGWFISRRSHFELFGRHVFTGTAVEAFLLLLAIALVAFGIGDGRDGKELVPMGFSGGSLFQRELMVIVTGCFFNAFTDPETLREVEVIMGGVWVFGQLVLFSMLGSRTTASIFPKITELLPVIAVGLLCRLLGVIVAIVLALVTGSSGHPFSWPYLLPDAFFCWISTIPRATIQGALGAVPVTQRFFQHCPKKRAAEDFISIGAKIYVICMSVCGMIILNSLGPVMCGLSSDTRCYQDMRCLEPCSEPKPPENVFPEDNGGDTDYALEERRAATDTADFALSVLAERYNTTPDHILEVLSFALQEGDAPHMADIVEESGSQTKPAKRKLDRARSDPLLAAPLNSDLLSEPGMRTTWGPQTSSGSQSKLASERGTGRYGRLQRHNDDLLFTQFECAPSVLRGSMVSSWKRPESKHSWVPVHLR